MSVRGFIKLEDGRQTLSHGEHFAYVLVPNSESVEIPSEQQMLIEDGIDVEGDLDIEGELSIERFSDAPTYPENFSFRFVLAGQTVTIASDQQMIVDEGIDVEGDLDIEGDLVLESFEDPIIPNPPPSDPENFSFQTIASGETKTIPVNQQMIVSDGVDIEGDLDIEGEMFVDGPQEDESFSWFFIPDGKRVVIPQNREMYCDSGIDIDGELDIDGALALGAA